MPGASAISSHPWTAPGGLNKDFFHKKVAFMDTFKYPFCYLVAEAEPKGPV